MVEDRRQLRLVVVGTEAVDPGHDLVYSVVVKREEEKRTGHDHPACSALGSSRSQLQICCFETVAHNDCVELHQQDVACYSHHYVREVVPINRKPNLIR